MFNFEVMKNEFLAHVGGKIKFYRERIKNVTQEYLAGEIGISSRALSDIENGKSDFSISRLNSIALALDISIHSLLSNESSQSQILNTFNNHGELGTNIMHQNQLEEYKAVYDLVIEAKNEQINLLTDLLNNKK